MKDYDAQLRGCKDRVTRLLCQLATKNPPDVMDVGRAVDDLNKAWDELTDCLVRHREERDRQIHRLLNELAEARK